MADKDDIKQGKEFHVENPQKNKDFFLKSLGTSYTYKLFFMDENIVQLEVVMVASVIFARHVIQTVKNRLKP